MNFGNLKGISAVWLSETDLTNLNAGEGETNFIDVKKYKKDGIEYPYVSGQAMRFYIKEAIRRNLQDNEYMCVPDDEGIPGCLKVVIKMEDFESNWKNIIKKCLACDLFGYMKPIKGGGSVTRVSPLKVSPAVGLLPFDENATLDFLTRKKSATVAEKERGDIVNIEIGTNIYKCGIAIDGRRLGGEENWSSGTVVIDYAIDEAEKKNRILKVLDGIIYLTDYSKQARLLTDFTPDVLCIALQNRYSHRLQKLFELNSNRELSIERLKEIIGEVQEYSNIYFGMIPEVIKNSEEVKSVLEELGIEVKTPKDAIMDACTCLKKS
ncbi:MAG TPA: type I-B CRISPR-associated protein Cas7/Cst2/DevR [Methanosarcinales archaeon]|nr:type I-B CRISPR-associated protein Cas7/Cst2/DevR [Methanosarcinales archaeon]